ncbi:uncharacterized protein LOC121952878 [Plectropomus leopardus]|uniref:uncharacterized protein LOC121952878 n=1 Tax=Plectropomus leopardus TaxID=160734 RepID=UPI001C4CC76C|nr:uncharacterized protein LOC121952878 [Plectropomus leopardus]
MNGLIFLLFCIEILGALLCGAQTAPGSTAAVFLSTTNPKSDSNADSFVHSSPIPSLPDLTSVADAISAATTQPPATASKSQSILPPTHPQPTPTSTPTSITMLSFYKKEYLLVFMVVGGLILLCVILMICCLFLMCKVCQLNKRIKMLSSDADPDYWMGTAKKNKSTPETEAKETTVLMADISQTVEEVGNGTNKEEGGKVNEDEQTIEEGKNEEGDAARSEEASSTPATVTGNAPSSKPQEEAADAQTAKAEAASSSTGTEEPKDVA